MKKNNIVAALCCAVVACVTVFALAGCGVSKDSVVGTWDLTSCESAENAEGTAGVVYSEDQVAAFNEVGQQFYVSFFDNGLVLFNHLGSVTNGKWEVSGSEIKMVMDTPGNFDPETGETTNTSEMTGKISGNKLDIESPSDNTVYHFAKSDEVKNPYDVNNDIVVADENGMSILMNEGEAMSAVTVADDENVTIKLNGKGVDDLGDPGFNMVVTNNSTSTINVWIPEMVTVGDQEVNAYMYITLYPTNTTTTFLQLDYDDLGLEEGNTDYSMITNVTGTIQVDNASSGETLGSYEFSITE